MYKLMVKPLVLAESALCKLAGTSPLDKDEQDSGTFAYAALLYQYWEKVDAKMLVLLHIAGVAAPRLAEAAMRKDNEQKSLPSSDNVVNIAQH